MKTIKLLPSGSVMEQDDPLQNATPLKFVLNKGGRLRVKVQISKRHQVIDDIASSSSPPSSSSTAPAAQN
jgi:hypothetical protein